MNYKSYIQEVKHWPQENITFKDISPFLLEPKCFSHAIDTLYARYKDLSLDKIVGIDSRGFIFASVLAYKLNVGLVLARKKGKLPEPKISESYNLEYGSATLEIKKDSITPKDKVIIVDDVLATGGTFSAVRNLVIKREAELIEGTFLIDIRKEIGSQFKTETPLFSLIEY